MTASEKEALREKVIRSAFTAGSAPAETASGPGMARMSTYFRAWMSDHIGSSVVAALALLVFAGGGVAFAATRALPGDALYGMKVGLFEPVRGSLAAGPAGKAAWQAELIGRRLTEAEALAAEGRLDATRQSELEALLDRHTASYSADIALAEREGPSAAQGIGSTLLATIAAHVKVFNDISAYASTEPTSTAESAEAAKHFKGKAEAHLRDPQSPWANMDSGR